MLHYNIHLGYTIAHLRFEISQFKIKTGRRTQGLSYLKIIGKFSLIKRILATENCIRNCLECELIYSMKIINVDLRFIINYLLWKLTL